MAATDVPSIPPRELWPYVPIAQARWLANDPARPWREIEGTLVFADVSGFTPLTERLARRGKVGAELLTDVLNEVFTSLLTVSSDHGGDLLKFGGDALFLLFSGPGHAVRAVAAAHGLQTVLRPYRRLRTPGGTVSLRMSIGLESGPVALFLVGGSHRELLVTGPTVTAAADLETAAHAGEVLVGPTVAELLPSECLGAAKSPGVVLRRPPRPSAAPTAEGPVPAAVLEGVPVGLRAHLGAVADGEHRRAVLTFLQFRGVDDVLAASGPAAVAAGLDRVVRAVQEACERHDVCFLATDVDRNGGKILLAAGVPTATTNDADRTLYALLEVLGQDLPFSLRAGVNLGRAFAVDIGAPHRRTFAVMGDPTNLAARVMGKADPGRIVATRAVVDALQADFITEALEPFPVKGKSHLIEACVVRAIGRRSRPRRDVRSDRDERPVVGREEELALLRRTVDQARDGNGSVVELVGEPGIGKSALLRATLEHAGDLPRLSIEGAQYAANSPYAVLRQPLRGAIGVAVTATDAEVADRLTALAAHLSDDVRPWLPLLAVPFGAELPPTAETRTLDAGLRRPLLHRLLVELLGAALSGPALLTVEDTHWLDDASAELLEQIVAAAGQRGWAAVLTRRDVPARLGLPELGIRLSLPPLHRQAARELVEQAASDRLLPPDAITALVERAGGNPLFLQELLAAVGTDVTDLPETVEATIAARIDRLATEDRQLLRYASVLGTQLDVDLLRELVTAEAPTAPADRLTERLRGFLVWDGTATRFRFEQTLVRDVAYEGLPFKLRRRLHGRAGNLVEERAGADLEEWADLLSFHYDAAQERPKAWRFSRLAGDRARQQAAPVEAATFYERALRAARYLGDLPADEVADVQEAFADVAELTGRYEVATDAYRDARRLVRADPLRVAALCRKEGLLREHAAHPSDALRWFTRGLRLLDELEPTPDTRRLRAELTLAYGATRLRQGRYRSCLSYLHGAVEQAQALGEKAILAHAYYLLDWALTDLGRPESHRYREVALPIYEELGDFAGQANVLNNIGVDAYYEGRWSEAIELYERSREARERAGDLVQLATAANNIGEIRSDQGHLAEARELFTEALAIWSSVGYPVGTALATSNLGRLAAREGNSADAQDLLREATGRFAAIGTEAFVLETEARRAEAALLANDPVAARALAVDVEQRSQRLGGMPVLRSMCRRLSAYAEAQLGDVDAAWEALADAVATARAATARFELALALEAIVAVGELRGEDTTAAAQEAADLFAGLGVVRTAEVPLAGVTRA